MHPTMRGATFSAVLCLSLTLLPRGDAELVPGVTVPPLLPAGDTSCGDLGSFSNSYPWTSPTRPVPPPQCNFNVTFWLCKRGSNPVLLPTRPTLNFDGTGFDPARKTVFIAHGFNDYVLNFWPQTLAESIEADTGDNIIAVDWSPGAKGPDYLQATSNARITGAEIGRVIKYLIHNYNFLKRNITLIGHSLGAHICSYAANAVNGVPIILGLDPAQPLFEYQNDNILHLDKSDACFVQVIHTNALPFLPFLGYGYIEPCGDVDFYPNGGAVQPGCPKVEPLLNGTLRGTLNSSVVTNAVTTCNHRRAYELLIDSVQHKECIMWGHSISSCNVYTSTLASSSTSPPTVSNSCEEDTCSPMGLNATMFKAEGCFMLSTKAASPYCIPDSQADIVMALKSFNEVDIIQTLCARKSITI